MSPRTDFHVGSCQKEPTIQEGFPLQRPSIENKRNTSFLTTESAKIMLRLDARDDSMLVERHGRCLPASEAGRIAGGVERSNGRYGRNELFLDAIYPRYIPLLGFSPAMECNGCVLRDESNEFQ